MYYERCAEQYSLAKQALKCTTLPKDSLNIHDQISRTHLSFRKMNSFIQLPSMHMQSQYNILLNIYATV